MDILTVFANKELAQDSCFVVRVYWKTGLHRKKAVDVRLALTCQDPQAAAEAVVIRYLLGEANIFNTNRTGINLRIVVSKGAIKKMARQATTKADLYEYGYPILTRYGEAKVSVSKDLSWFPLDEQLHDVPLIDGESLRGIEKLEVGSMGKIAVTRHALMRYGEYCGTVDMTNSWRNLHRRLNGRLDQITLPAKVLLHKLRTYGDSPEVWMSDDNPLHYVFLHKKDHRVLVTVFNKDPNEKIERFLPSLANRS